MQCIVNSRAEIDGSLCAVVTHMLLGRARGKTCSWAVNARFDCDPAELALGRAAKQWVTELLPGASRLMAEERDPARAAAGTQRNTMVLQVRSGASMRLQSFPSALRARVRAAYAGRAPSLWTLLQEQWGLLRGAGPRNYSAGDTLMVATKMLTEWTVRGEARALGGPDTRFGFPEAPPAGEEGAALGRVRARAAGAAAVELFAHLQASSLCFGGLGEDAMLPVGKEDDDLQGIRASPREKPARLGESQGDVGPAIGGHAV